MGFSRLLPVLGLSLLLTLCIHLQNGHGVRHTLKESITILKSNSNLADCVILIYNGNGNCSNTTLGDPKTVGLPCRNCFNITLKNNNTDCLQKEQELYEVQYRTDRNVRKQRLTSTNDFASNVTCEQFGNHTTEDILGYWLSLLQRKYHNLYCKLGVNCQ
uniref:Ov9.5 protein n=1 Tax=Ovine gammaherpesvirus 2 TaxID=10398 RepID=A0A6M2ZJP3_9GAMA|nr:Ov9.5 protein precursor [Ovine gammaherpesvirus 2]